MTEKLFTGMLNHNQNKKTKKQNSHDTADMMRLFLHYALQWFQPDILNYCFIIFIYDKKTINPIITPRNIPGCQKAGFLIM